MTRVEDATTGNDLFGVAIALEDVNWLQNDDKRRTRTFVEQATRRIELSRLPSCRWWEWGCKVARRAIQQQIDAGASTP